MFAALPPHLVEKAQRAAFALVGLTVLVTVAGVVWKSQNSLNGGLSALPWGAVGLLVAAALTSNLLRFWRYHTTGKALGLNVPFFNMMFIYVVGFGLLPTPGKVGTAIRLWLLKHRYGLSYGRTAPLFVMDLVTDALAIFALCALALLTLPDNPNLHTVGALLAVVLGFGAAGVLLAPRVLRGVVKLGYLLVGKRKKRTFSKMLRLMTTTRKGLGPRLLAITITQSFTGWALISLATSHFLTALGAPLGASEGAAVTTLASIGGFVSLMPAGVGGAELSMAGMLALFQVPLSTAVVATAVWRLATMWLSVVLGLMLLPVALRRMS